MKKLWFLVVSLAAFGVVMAAADKETAAAVPVQTIATVEAIHGHTVPVLRQGDFIVMQGGRKLQVTDATPLIGGEAGLELYILIDDASRMTLGSQLMDLRRFIGAQPSTTAIGVGYMHNGAVETAAKLTNDHALAARVIRLPAGISSSPYLSLSELVKHWPASSARHEVIMITSGADPLGGEGPENFYLDNAIADAQRAGVIVYAIYTPGIGHAAHSYWEMHWGQNYLAELTDETGGEGYMLGLGSPVSIAPYLTEVDEQLAHQYRVAFLASPEGKAGLKSIKLRTEVPNAEVVAAHKVYIPAE
jgi:hypothetical protein